MIRRILPLLALLATPTAAQSPLIIPAPQPVFILQAGDLDQPVFPRDIAAMETSESGGITDVFIRLAPEAARALAALDDSVQGGGLRVVACGHPLMAPVPDPARDSGTIYIPDTNAIRAEALRALWSGRATCADIKPEVFQNGP